MNLGLRIVLCALACAALASVAAAQEARSETRLSGLMLGLSLGVGGMSCDGCASETALATELRLGYRFGERVAFGLTASGIESFSFEESASQVVNTASLTLWATPRLWVRGGVGVGRASNISGLVVTDQTDWGLGFMVAAGYEVHRVGHFAFDLSARYARASPEFGALNNVSGLVAVNFFSSKR
jgi:opacity protein-like surface antigen